MNGLLGLAVLGLMSAGAAPDAGVKKPYPYISTAKVVGYGFNLRKKGRPECTMPVNPDGTLCKSVEGPGKTLSPAQVLELNKLMSAKNTFGGDVSKCFIPHHAFVYYDASGKVVGQLSICFMCDRLRGAPKVKAKPRKGYKTGLSKKRLKGLRKLCVDVGLPACHKGSR